MSFKNIRRRLAMFIAGEQALLVLPNEDGRAFRAGNWEDMSDESLVATMRYGLSAMTKLETEKAVRTNVPLSVLITADAGMSLIRQARKCNADTLTISQNGQIAGEDVGAWQIRVTKLPDDHEFGEPGITETEYASDGRLTRFGYSITIPPTPATVAVDRGGRDG